MMVFGLDSLLSVVYVGGYTAVSRFPMALYFGVYAMNCFATLMLWYIYALGWYSIPLNLNSKVQGRSKQTLSRRIY